jgi:DNA primase
VSLDTLSLSSSQRVFLEEATATYEKTLDRAASYLVGRGLDQAAATGSRLGLASDPLPGHERFAGRLALPYVTPGGVVAIKFRCIEDHDCRSEAHGKYDGPSGQKARLFNTRALLDKGDTVAICEGEMDALVCHHVLGVPAVGTPGTQWMDHWGRCFADFERVLVVADHDVHPNGDSPGIKHARKVQAHVRGSEVVLPPEGMDLGEWVQQYGADEVRRSLGVAV